MQILSTTEEQMLSTMVAKYEAMFKGHRACGPPSGPSKKGKLIKTVPRFNGKRWQVDCIAYVCFL